MILLLHGDDPIFKQPSTIPNWMNDYNGDYKTVVLSTSLIIPTLGADPLQRLFLLKILCIFLFFTFLVLLWAHGNESSYHKLLLSLFFLVLRMSRGKPLQSGSCSLWNGPIGHGAHPCFLRQDILGSPSAFLCTSRIDLGNYWLMN